MIWVPRIGPGGICTRQPHIFTSQRRLIGFPKTGEIQPSAGSCLLGPLRYSLFNQCHFTFTLSINSPKVTPSNVIIHRATCLRLLFDSILIHQASSPLPPSTCSLRRLITLQQHVNPNIRAFQFLSTPASASKCFHATSTILQTHPPYSYRRSITRFVPPQDTLIHKLSQKLFSINHSYPSCRQIQHLILSQSQPAHQSPSTPLQRPGSAAMKKFPPKTSQWEGHCLRQGLQGSVQQPCMATRFRVSIPSRVPLQRPKPRQEHGLKIS